MLRRGVPRLLALTEGRYLRKQRLVLAAFVSAVLFAPAYAGGTDPVRANGP